MLEPFVNRVANRVAERTAAMRQELQGRNLEIFDANVVKYRRAIQE